MTNEVSRAIFKTFWAGILYVKAGGLLRIFPTVLCKKKIIIIIIIVIVVVVVVHM